MPGRRRNSPVALPARPPTCLTAAFIAHAVGGALYLMVVSQKFFSPVDLFIHHTWLHDEAVQNLVAGFGFYAFSLLVLYLRPPAAGWGIAYAVASWFLFLPVAMSPYLGMSGMMRRVAEPAEYGAWYGQPGLFMLRLRIVCGLAFVLVQAALIRFAGRRVRNATPSLD